MNLRMVIPLTLFLASTAAAGPPFKTDDPEPVGFRHWEFYIASVQEFQKGESDVTSPHFEVNYGAAPNLQLHLLAPMEYTHSAEGTHYGYSDTEVGFKYRFLEESTDVPQAGIFPLVEVPTGNADEHLGAGSVQVYFPAWVQKSFGKLTTYAGGGVWYNPGINQKNWGFAGWEAQYDFSETLTLGGELYYQTASSIGSQSNTGYNVGGFINLNENDHILFSLGRTVPDGASITGYVGFQLTI